MLQCYSLRNYPDFASEIGEHDGVAVDLFIGEERFIGKGFGKAMLRSYVLNVVEQNSYSWFAVRRVSAVSRRHRARGGKSATFIRPTDFEGLGLKAELGRHTLDRLGYHGYRRRPACGPEVTSCRRTT
ncbi:hypothetical protein Q1M64_10940 (plasmid) [Sinorhizobium meliloti]|nr:hypothetical protein LZK74_11435 [Sinorhizobium meliloti]WKL25448.1 hypothetical protein Q1M63_12340 [Sinorhizobium meliloti]WKL29912.1 hypothetical protein Q1M65_10490 [Sinorhizobium meliloti]WKL35508.1 hypothetical protein Q1M62_10135 [Sinorhizobium meliloti]WKL40353.1 hypothetical protein Q1M64_10940 [Sinorhizobium meliloti]